MIQDRHICIPVILDDTKWSQIDTDACKKWYKRCRYICYRYKRCIPVIMDDIKWFHIVTYACKKSIQTLQYWRPGWQKMIPDFVTYACKNRYRHCITAILAVASLSQFGLLCLRAVYTLAYALGSEMGWAKRLGGQIGDGKLLWRHQRSCNHSRRGWNHR